MIPFAQMRLDLDRVVKKFSLVFFRLPNPEMRFPCLRMSNGLPSLYKTANPFATHRVAKNRTFDQSFETLDFMLGRVGGCAISNSASKIRSIILRKDISPR